MSFRDEAHGSEAHYCHPDVARGRSEALAPQAQTGLALVGSIRAKPVEDVFRKAGEVLRGLVLAGRVGIPTKADIENPAKPVLKSPVGPRRCSELSCRQLTKAGGNAARVLIRRRRPYAGAVVHHQPLSTAADM